MVPIVQEPWSRVEREEMAYLPVVVVGRRLKSREVEAQNTPDPVTFPVDNNSPGLLKSVYFSTLQSLRCEEKASFKLQ